MADLQSYFHQNRWYFVGDLRFLREEIVQLCREDPRFGNRLRQPRGDDRNTLKPWREEHHPLTILADQSGWSDDSRFRWTPNEPADFHVEAAGEVFGLQCTTAYPEWPKAVGKSGGHTRALERMRLNSGAPTFGGGRPSEPTARGVPVDLKGWRDGIRCAILSKLNTKYQDLRLLIYADQAGFHLFYSDFTEALTPAVETYAQEWRRIFEAIYVVDKRKGAFLHLKRE